MTKLNVSFPHFLRRFLHLRINGGILALIALSCPAVTSAEVIWSGDFSTGDFTQWPDWNGNVRLNQVPPYGRPPAYSTNVVSGHVGNGELSELVAATARTIDIPGIGNVSYAQGPTRGSSEYAAKFTVKNSNNWTEPADCDPSTNCNNRRAQLQGENIWGHSGLDLIPHMSTRWLSFSVYLDPDFQVNSSGSGFGPSIYGLKAQGSSPLGGYFAITLEGPNGSWRIFNRWTDVLNPDSWSYVPWQQSMAYDSGQPSPESGTWKDESDFPNPQASRAALGSVNKGGWTDWIIYNKHDYRTVANGGQGRIRVWKREDAGPWIEVVDIRPKTTTRGGRTFAHGTGFNFPDYGYGSNTGMYMSTPKTDVAHDMTMYLANVKVGNENATFAELSPDGSTP